MTLDAGYRARRPRITSVMTGSIRSISIGVATATLALGLAACNQTTYGTGTTVGMQTIEDLAGIADMSGQKKDAIKYTARPALVAPPPGTPLPAPGSDSQAVASNWPTDPDVQAQRIKQEAAAREKFCSQYANKDLQECRDPGFRIAPAQQANASRQPSQTLVNMNVRASEAAHSTAEQDAMAVKLFAQAKGSVAVDANGQPVRKYLTDPPSSYREPDPNAPVVFDKKPAQKKWRWPWEKATDTVTPGTTADGSPPG